MANRKKPEDQKISSIVPIRVKADLKAALDEMANETGVSTSERARTCLEEQVRKWRAHRSG